MADDDSRQSLDQQRFPFQSPSQIANANTDREHEIRIEEVDYYDSTPSISPPFSPPRIRTKARVAHKRVDGIVDMREVTTWLTSLSLDKPNAAGSSLFHISDLTPPYSPPISPQQDIGVSLSEDKRKASSSSFCYSDSTPPSSPPRIRARTRTVQKQDDGCANTDDDASVSISHFKRKWSASSCHYSDTTPPPSPRRIRTKTRTPEDGSHPVKKMPNKPKTGRFGLLDSDSDSEYLRLSKVWNELKMEDNGIE